MALAADPGSATAAQTWRILSCCLTAGRRGPLLQELPRFVAFSADPGSAAATIQAILKWTAGANRDLHQQVAELLWRSYMLLLLEFGALVVQHSGALQSRSSDVSVPRAARLPEVHLAVSMAAACCHL